jgi:hypothetical protein
MKTYKKDLFICGLFFLLAGIASASPLYHQYGALGLLSAILMIGAGLAVTAMGFSSR